MPNLTIEAHNLAKEYDHKTILRRINFRYQAARAVAITGRNGSGKSTLLRLLSGMVTATHGDIVWSLEGQKLPSHRYYEYLSYCSPGFYFDGRFTVDEIMNQYHAVKPFRDNLSPDNLIELIDFQEHRKKFIDELSSGMNQRIRLVLTICASAPVLFLDEPCSNLDIQGVRWYENMISRYATDKLIFVASNDPREYAFCQDELSMDQ